MVRGRLRVMLGAAPGVGKTFAMLEEGSRLRDDGRDVVIAVVETHGRAETAALLGRLELLDRTSVSHRGIRLDEMDLDGVLARHPDVALVDELAHSNAPGSRNDKRWEDIAELLDAGIDVISTVNVQHIESLGDVVRKITGIEQRETIPDSVVRAADQIELVDLAPQALRDRLADGRVYPAERIDAAMSNFFRLGNLTALRELALLWLADEVDNALQHYRVEHGIDGGWPARERVVVALTGGSEGETLLRRGARIAARSAGGELLAVHVTGQDGLRVANPDKLMRQRSLVEELGGSYHQVVGDDVPEALVEFARGVDATQLVIGVSRRSRLAAILTGPGIGATVIRLSGDIDVHIVAHSAAGRHLHLPRVGAALSLRRRVWGFVIALVGGPLLVWLLIALRAPGSITSEVLSFQLLVVVVALVGGSWPAIFAGILSGLTLDFLFVQPRFTIAVDAPHHLFALALYVTTALLVGYVVGQAARRSQAALRARAESELLATVAGSVVRGEGAPQALVSRAREAFRLSGVRLVTAGTAAVTDGEPTPAGPSEVVPVGDRAELELFGRDLDASERRLLGVIVAQLEAVLEHSDLSETAREVGPLAAADRVRTALLAAVSHDLRRPLAAATAAVGSLRATDVELAVRDRSELLDTAAESLDALASLITDLLDVTRLQAGVLAVDLRPIDVDAVLSTALDELAVGPADVELSLAPSVRPVRADPVLLERAVVNILENARRFSPSGVAVRLATSAFADTVQIRVIDRGPGISGERRDEVFVPFQRLGDTDNDTGLGLGLSLSRGFVEGMGGTLDVEETPGGGLTMVIALPVWQEETR